MILNEKEYTCDDLKGLALFGQRILILIDQGEKEDLSIIYRKILDGELVEYLATKYSIIREKISPSVYNFKALNDFFTTYSCYAESRRSGIFNNDNGLLTIPSIILGEMEL